MLRWSARVIACVALVVGLGVTALPWWLQTGWGHRTVERVVTHLLNQRIPGSVTVGKLGGRVIDGLHARDVVVRNPAGQEVGRAERMTVRWRPFALLRHRRIEELVVERPVVLLDRGQWRKPPSKKRSGRSTTIERIVAVQGRLIVRNTMFENVSGSASLHSHSNLDVHALTARIGPSLLTGYGIVGWGHHRHGWVATRMAVRDPRLSGRGEIFYTPGRLEGSVDALTLAAPSAEKLLGGRGAVSVEGQVQGAPEELVASADASQGARGLRIRAWIDGPRRAVTFDARLTGRPRPIRIHARARYVGGALSVPALAIAVGNSRLDGSGSVAARELRASLTLRLAPAEARLLSLRAKTPLRAQLALHGPFADLAVHARARLGAARLAVDARVDALGRRGHAVVVARKLRPADLVAHAPALTVSSTLTLDGRWLKRALVADARLTRGRLTVGGRTFDELAGAGSVRLARDGDANIRRLTGRWASRRGRPRLAARGTVRWRADRLALAGVTVALDASRWSGEATWLHQRATGAQHLHASADSMTLSPELVGELTGRRPSQPWVGRTTVDGAPEDLALHAEVTTSLGTLAVAAQLRRDHGELQLAHVDARLGDSHLVGGGRFRQGRLTGSVDELVLAPPLVHALLPVLDPAWPIRIRGSVNGPLQGLDLALRVDGGPSSSQLRVHLSWPTRRFRLVGHVDTMPAAFFQRERTKVRGTVDVAGEGQLTKNGVVGTLTLRNARGFMMTSPFYRGAADVRFDGRSAELEHARVEVPGAKIGGHGYGSVDEGFHIGYGVVITDAFALRHVPAALRVVIGINGILPGRTIEGALDKRPGRKIEFSHRVLPIGVSQLVVLFRVLTGRTPKVDHQWRQ